MTYFNDDNTEGFSMPSINCASLTLAKEATPAQHTQGPWHVGMRPGPIVYGPKGEQIVNMTDPMLLDAENIGNTFLIAAAPELLKALELLMQGESIQQGARDGATMGAISSAIDAARAAISKAKGV